MLKYLFEAEFIDGTKIIQDQKDTSKIDSKRNTFYDVLHSDKKLKSITYREQKIWNPTVIKVDYISGIFIINGVQIVLDPVKKIEKPIRDMLVRKHIHAKYNTKTGSVVSTQGGGEERIFYVGFDSDCGKRVIGIK